MNPEKIIDGVQTQIRDRDSYLGGELEELSDHVDALQRAVGALSYLVLKSKLCTVEELEILLPYYGGPRLGQLTEGD